MKKTYKSILILVTLITLLILYLINSNVIVNAIIDYSILFLTKLFPVSLLFFIFSTLLIDYGLIELIQYYLKINTSSLYVLLISAISGFPSGAKYTKELLEKNLIDENTANKIIMFSHFPNPLFILGSVYLVLKDKEICLKLLLAIIISNIIIYIFSKDKKSTKNNIKKLKVPSNFSNVLSNAVTNAFNTLLLIYGTSLFFYLVATIITKYITLNTNSFIILNGFFDLTKGVFSTISEISPHSNLERNLSSRVVISFGGLSIHMQVKSIITDTSIKYKYFFIGRIIGTILALIIFILIL